MPDFGLLPFAIIGASVVIFGVGTTFGILRGRGFRQNKKNDNKNEDA